MVLIVETTLRTKSLCLIYDEQAEIQFSNKYKGYESINCFLNLENMIENVCNKYASIEGLPEDKRPFAQSLMGEEIKKVTEKFGKKKKGKQMCKFENRLEEAYSNKSYTFVQDLEEGGVTSVKANACKKQTTVKFSTRFISSKLLINAKISLASFIYDCIDTFCFPNEETQKIYDEHNILKVLPYLLMTDMDFASLKFIVIADKACDLDERGMREVLLKIFLDNNIPKRLNLSSNVFDQFGKRNERIRKQVGLYEFENIVQSAYVPKNILNYTVFCTKSMKNIRKLEKELREWILITTLTDFYTLTKLKKVQIGLLKKQTNTFPKQER